MGGGFLGYSQTNLFWWLLAQELKGAAKRKFIAQTVVALGHGGQSVAEQELGWNRVSYISRHLTSHQYSDLKKVTVQNG